MKRLIVCLSTLALLAVGLSGCGNALNYAAVVNGVTISRATIDHDLSDISHNGPYVKLFDQAGGPGPVAGAAKGTYNKSFVAVLLNEQIKNELIRQRLVQAKALPITKAQLDVAKPEAAGQFTAPVKFSDFPQRYQDLLALQSAYADAFIAALGKTTTDAAVQQFYDQNTNLYATEACVRHILIADQVNGQLDYPTSLDHANRLKAQLDAGADYATLAKSDSKDNQGTGGGTAANGGKLPGSAADGCFTTADLAQLITEFATAVATLPVNQVSAPVKTQFGYHLILVTSRTIEPLDATVRSNIIVRMARDQLVAMQKSAKVKVNPEFGTYNPSAVSSNGQVLGVTPPAAPNLSAGTPTTLAASAGAGAGG
ncbi:MAG: peptidylprolyl isomerase [Actinomycetota bacterium]|nr:peptidylprolyl isomerase [Actinomycetota bacterium]